jgi:hypothetical protein
MNRFDSKGGEQNIGQGDHSTGNQSPAIVADGSVTVTYNNSPPAPLPIIIPHQLPSLDTCFLGRDKQLAELLPLLHPGKVAAVCGPGGMGKSALAAQAVRKLETSRFPDGIIFHSFYHQPSTDMALQTICEAYKVEAKAGLASTVRQVLAGRKALLILDGAEEADDLPALLKLRGGCGVLITSRNTDDAPDELLELKKLEKLPAEEVFRHYSKIAGDDANVAGICKILDGWPVALRIAGRYLRKKESAEEYLKWLKEEPFKELGSGKHEEKNAALLLRRSVAQVSDDARLALGLIGTPVAWGEAAWGTFIWGGGAWLTKERVAALLDGDEYRARNALNELVDYGFLEKQDKCWIWSHMLIYIYVRRHLSHSKQSAGSPATKP